MATGIGETLRAARRQQGVALADAAAETRVRESYLAALEEEDFAALGGDVYVKGFLRSYARFLRLDPEPLLDAYRSQYERPVDEVTPLATQSVSPVPSEGRPVVVVAVGVVVLIVALFAVIGIISGDDPAETELAGGGPAPEPVATSEPPVTDLPSDLGSEPVDEPTESVPLDDLRVRFVVSGDGGSWMRVTVDGAVEREELQPVGTSETYQPDDSIILRVGDASAVEVKVNGEDLGELGEPKQVVEITCEIGEPSCSIVDVPI